MSIAELLKDAVDNIERSILEYLPHHVYIAYSGGKDSAVLLDIVSRLRPHNLRGIMAIDTGLSCDGWQGMINKHASSVGLPVTIATGKGWNWYAENVMAYGFGYTPNQHVVYYRMLKERAIHSHIANHTAKTRIMYLTGVRRAESIKRADTPLSMQYRRRITTNPLINWTDDAVSTYLDKIALWWANPYYNQVGSSGDCLCGWTCKNKASDIVRHNPNIGEKIARLSDDAVSAGMWPYGTRGDVYIGPIEVMPADSLCVNCERG